MWFEEEDVLEILLLKPVDDLPLASLIPQEEAVPLIEPQEAQVTAMHPPGCKEQALKPKSAAGLGEAVTEPQGT